MVKFADIDNCYSEFESSKYLLQSIPYDGTSTWGKGADKGFDAFIEASENMELYDIETDTEVYKRGIHVLPVLTDFPTPESVYREVYDRTAELLKTGKFITFFGGEHSISIGVIKAFSEKFDDLTVLHLDAHADLRPEYHNTPYNHACAVNYASLNTNLIQVGIRSMDISENDYLDYDKCYFAHKIHNKNKWMDKSINQMSDNVYITIDLDVFDPSIMPSTGTPEPGGMDWYSVVRYLKRVFKYKNIVGFDLVELSPIEGINAPNFLAAKLYYKLLSYKEKYNE